MLLTGLISGIDLGLTGVLAGDLLHRLLIATARPAWVPNSAGGRWGAGCPGSVLGGIDRGGSSTAASAISRDRWRIHCWERLADVEALAAILVPSMAITPTCTIPA